MASNVLIPAAFILVTLAPLPLLAAAGADSSADESLQEVVVTARYRAEDLQRAPIAITALSGGTLEARNLTDITGLSGQAPNLIIDAAGAGFGPAAFASIRGIGMNDFSLAFEPGVAIYVDDVYEARPIGAIFDLLDLERVEVLRGPQGTLFGQNAIGGAIRLVSVQPKGDGSGYVEAETGSYNRRNFRGSWDVAIVPDRLFIRFSASSKTQDGYVKVYDYACEHPTTAGTIKATTTDTGGSGCQVGTQGDINIQSGRAALRFIASDDIELNVIADYENQHQEQPADQLAVISTDTAAAGYTPIWNQTVSIPTYGIPYDSRFVSNSPYSTYNNYYSAITGLRYPNEDDVKQYGISAALDWKLSDDLRFKSITAYRDYDSYFAVNSSGSPIAINMTYNHDPHRQLSQEVTLSGTYGPLDWTTGIYYYHGGDADRGYAEVYPPDILAFNFDDEQLQTNKAAFLHGIYHATDKLSFTAGIRRTIEDKSISILRTSIATNELLFPVTDLRESDKRWSPTANVEYQWTADIMTYAQASSGFRGGGFSPRPNDQTQIASFGPEDLKTFEGGIKTSWFDGRVRANAAVFYSRYKGIQLPSLSVDPEGIIATITQNVGRAHIEGAELEFDATPLAGLLLNASAGYLHYKNDELGTAVGLGGATYSTVPPRTPTVTANAGGQYTFRLGGAGSLIPRLDVVYQSKVYFDSANTELGAQNGYALVNGRLTWSPVKNEWSVSLSGTNLTNKVYATSSLNLVEGFGTDELSIAPPREWGLSVRRTF